MHLINRYVEEVLIHVAYGKRSKVEQEVREKINDEIVRQLGDESIKGIDSLTDEQIFKVLDAMGNPRELARGYEKSMIKLVGIESTVPYKRVLLISFIYIVISNIVAYFGMDFSNGYKLSAFIVFRNLIFGLVGMYVFVTLLFMILNHFRKKEELKEEHARGEWTALHLRYPKVKRPNKRGDYLFGLFIKVLLLQMLYIGGEYLSIGAIIRENGVVHRVPVFNASRIQDYRVFITILLVISIGYSIVALWRNRPDFVLLIWKGISSLASGIGCIILFRYPGIWNTKFLSQIQELSSTSVSFTSITMQNISNFTIAIILVIAAIDIMHAFYRFFTNI